MKKITGDVQLLTSQLNDAKMVNKDILSDVEMAVKGEITKQIDAATGQIGNLSE